MPAATVVTGASIADAPISGTAIPIFATEGAPFTGNVAVFLDANPNGTVSDFTATINWGDSSPLDSNARVVLVGGTATSTTFAVFGSHVYTSPGSFSTVVQVKDAGGNTATITGSSNVTV